MSANQNALLLRPWLEDKINKIHGINWVVEEERIFKIAWYRVQPGYNSARDFQIFVEWAKHKGHYNEHEPDYKKWKIRLRNAMNKARDIQHLEEMSDEKSAEPFRIYQFLNEQDTNGCPEQRMVSGDSTNSSPSASSPDGHPADDRGCDQNNAVPTVVEEMSSSSSTEGVGSPSTTQMAHDKLYRDNNVTCVLGAVADSNEAEMFSDPTHTQEVDTVFHNAEQSPDVLTDNSSLRLRIQYRGCCVLEQFIGNPRGCVLYAGDTRNVGQMYLSPDEQEKLYGPRGLQEISFPLAEGIFTDPADQEIARKLLESTDRGLQLESNNVGVFITKRCRCRIFYDSHLTPDGPEKVTREQKVKVFDREKFMESVKKYAGKNGPKPRNEIQLGIGQKWVYGENVNEVLVAVSVETVSSCPIIQIVEQNRGAPSMADLSAETPTDEFNELMRALCLQEKNPMSQ